MPTVPLIHLPFASQRTIIRRPLRLVIAILLTALSAVSSNATAQSQPDEAKEHYRKGTAAYNLGKYAEAAQEYELSYRATLDPALLFNAAQSYRLAGDRKKALTAYKSYLRSAPDGDKRDLAEAKVREIETALNYDDPFSGGDSRPLPKPSPTRSPSPERRQVPPLKLEETPPASAATVLTEIAPARSQPPPSVPLYRHWPFWAAVGGVAVAVVIVAILATGSSSPQEPQTTFGTMRF